MITTMPSPIEWEVIEALLRLNPKKPMAAPKAKKLDHQSRYKMRCAYLKKARETRLAIIAARKK